MHTYDVAILFLDNIPDNMVIMCTRRETHTNTHTHTHTAGTVFKMPKPRNHTNSQ